MTQSKSLDNVFKLNNIVSVKEPRFGAAGDGVTDDTGAFSDALAASSDIDIPEGDYSVVTVTVPANKMVVGRGVLSNVVGRLVAGAKSVISNLKLSFVSGVIPLGVSSGADDVVIKDIEVDTQQYATTFLLNGTNGLSLVDSKLVSTGYALLTDNTGQTVISSRVRIQDNYLSSIDADAIEINSPTVGAEVTGVIVTGNFLETTATSGGGTSGFAFGNANNKQWLFNNNVVLGSRKEAIHVEDDQSGGVVVGNSLKSRSNAVVIYGNDGAKPFPFIGNNIQSETASSNFGIYNNYSSPHPTISGMPFVGNVISGFSIGAILQQSLASAPTIHLLDNNSLYDCTDGVNSSGGGAGSGFVRIPGVSFIAGATSLFSGNQGAVGYGKALAPVAPTNIISGAYSGRMPNSCDGFGYSIPLFTTDTSGAPTNYSILFPAGANQRFFGRLKFNARRNGVNDWLYVGATVHWDGTTLTLSDVISRLSGASWSAPTFVVSGGNLYFTLTSTVATAFAFNWVEFDGEYWDE